MFTPHRLSLLRIAPALLLSLACASAPAASSSAPRNAADVLTQEELADPLVAGQSLLDAIRHLRPRYLNDRGAPVGATGGLGVQVSIDGSSLVPVGVLADMAVTDAAEVRYLSVADANLRFGLKGSFSPVLLVTLRRH